MIEPRTKISPRALTPAGKKRNYRQMRTYQTALPGATRISITPEIARNLKASITTILQTGFWYCHTCEARTEREEGEQGQPAHCERCDSSRIEYCPPLTVQDRNFINPEDLI